MAALNERKREILLGALLVAFVVVLWRMLGGPADGGGTTETRGGPSVRIDLATLKIYPVAWEALASPRPGYDPAGRNIFQFGVIPPPPPPKLTPEEEAAILEAQRRAEEERRHQEELVRAQQAAEQQRLIEEAARRASEPPPPPPPPPKPQPPPITYKFIGYIGPPESKIAVLHDGVDLIFVHEGEEVGKGLRILEIGYESVKFGFTDPQFKGETRTLPMTSSY